MRRRFRRFGEKLHLRSPKPTTTTAPAISPFGSSQASIPGSDQIATGSSRPSVSTANPGPIPIASQQTTWKATLAHGAENFVAFGAESSDAYGPLKSVFSGIRAVLKVYHQYSDNKEKLGAIITRLDSFKMWDTGSTKDSKEELRRNGLERKLDKIYGELQKMGDQNRGERVANSAHDEAALAGYVEDIRDALMDYQVSLQQHLLLIALETMDKVELGLLNQLRHAQDASYMAGDRQKCLRGTRTDILRTIHTWAKDPDALQVYWLNGLAGTGKSTISQSFAEECFAEGHLGASFFCSRDSTDRSDIHLIFPTIAFDLAFRYPKFRAALIPVITSNPNIGSASLATQLQMLLVEPLQLAGISAVIVIDALDECKDENPASTILGLLGKHIDSVPLVKFFITGRPEFKIRSGFGHRTLEPNTDVFVLHEVKLESVDQDIQIYMRNQLLEIADSRSDLVFSIPWPNQPEITALAHKCGGLFIFASTTCKFIASPHGDPQTHLKMIIDLPKDTSNEGSLGVDTLYAQILEENHASAPPTLQVTKRLKPILAAIILVFNPVSRSALATLLGITPGEVLNALNPLHSLLVVPSSETAPIRTFHKSFPDYLTDPSRCKNLQFYVNPSVHHSEISISCLQLMNGKLKKNLCELPRFLMNKDVEDLTDRREMFIGDALEYACRFWAQHLCQASIENDAHVILGLVKELMEKHLLSWLEVLSICNGLHGGVSALHDVQSLLTRLKLPEKDLLNSVQDAERFLLRFFNPIQQSASHIYESMLPWSPELSLVRQRYLHPGEKCVKLVNAVDSKWDNCILKMEAGGIIVGIAFSNNHALFGCCTWWSLKLFDVVTGSLYAEMCPKGEGFCNFAFSPDDTIIATGSEDGWVSIWDVKTGDIFKSLKGHTSRVLSVAFSRQGVLASGSYDGTIRIWDTDSGECASTLVGEARAIRSISWSPQNQELAVARDNEDTKMETVEIWDTRTQTIRNANFAQSYNGRIAYSPNGSGLASADESPITIREAHSGDITQTHSPSGEISSSICYSPSGTQIAYGTDRGSFIWDLETDVHQLICEVANLTYIVFSPDGSSIATASFRDSVISIWHIDRAGIEQCRSFDDRTSKFTGFYMSWDGQRALSTSKDGPMKLWDAVTGMCLMWFNDPKEVRLATISNDNGLVASLSYMKDSLQIWSCADGTLLKTIKYGMVNPLPTSARFSPNAQQIITIMAHGGMVLWDVGTGTRIEEVDLSVTRRSYTINGEGGFIPSSGKALLLPPSSRELKFYEEDPNTEISSIVSETTSDDKRIRLAVPSRPVIDRAPLPEGYVPIVDDPFAIPFSLTETGWVEDLSGRRFFWVPEDVRHSLGDWSSRGRVWVTESGKFAFMDCSDLL